MVPRLAEGTEPRTTDRQSFHFLGQIPPRSFGLFVEAFCDKVTGKDTLQMLLISVSSQLTKKGVTGETSSDFNDREIPKVPQ